jgi:Domain of unknown function (DUF6268)
MPKWLQFSLMTCWALFRMLPAWSCAALVLLPSAGLARTASGSTDKAKTVAKAETVEREGRLYIPAFQLRYWYTGGVTLTDPGQPEAVSLRGHTLRLAGMFGHRFKRIRTTLIGSVRYDLTRYIERMSGGSWRRDTHHAPFVRLGLHQGLVGRWGLTAYTMVGLASDMKELSAGDLRLVVGAGATYTISRDLRFVFGAMYTSNFFIPLPLPLIAIHYRRAPWRLKLLIPQGASAWRELTDRVELGWVTGVVNRRYGMHDEQRVADEYSWLNVTTGPALRVYLHKGAYALVNAGYSVRFVRLTQGEETLYQDLSFWGGFASVTLGYMI